MKLHKEGFGIITVSLIVLAGLSLAVSFFLTNSLLVIVPLVVASLLFFGFILWFFRNPERNLQPNDKAIICPADGKVVVIEETSEGEYFNDKRLQVSIFMSPLNVHINRYPISGRVDYFKYHPGDYLVAWHPKSSTHNERTTIVVENNKGIKVLIRQIAGAVARRVVCYATVDKQAKQGEELGFIKFGSRVDLFLPLNTKINISLNQKVLGNKTIIGYLE